jgi:aryl-alcohol dehydrogenase (NADP+)
MEYGLLGTSELKISRACLGTMTWGQQNSDQDAHSQLDFALSRGVNFIDTAEMYPVPTREDTHGRSEAILGAWLAKRGVHERQQLVIATKCAGYSRNPKDLTWIRGDLKVFSAADIRRGVSLSLKRLQTDYIDLYQLHWPARNVPMFGGALFDPAFERDYTPIEETLRALTDEVNAGRIRYVGLSNETPWGMMQFLRLSEQFSLARVVTTQNAYNLINRVYESGLSEIGFREKVGLLAYSPLAFGKLSGKYLNGMPPESRFALFPQFGTRYGKPNVTPAVAAYSELARSCNLSPAKLALAFVNSRSFVNSTIFGGTSLAQLGENIDAFSVRLSPATQAEINAIHTRFTNPAP